MIWLALAAAAEEPAPAPVEPAPVEPAPVEPAPVEPAPAPVVSGERPPSEEVVIYGELRVRQARERVERLLEDLGYGADVVDEGDHVIWRHVEPWKGEVVLWDDGWMQVRRQPMRVEGRRMPWAETDTPLAWAGCVVWPWLCVRLGGGLVGHRKWLGVETKTVGHVHGPVEEWGDRIADLATERTVDTLPPRLEALWAEGAPLTGGPPLATMPERRAALRDYYLSRTDTVWGDAVRDAVRAFVYAVVQTSDAPYPEDELAVFRPAGDAP
jgi:hypothetical protein